MSRRRRKEKEYYGEILNQGPIKMTLQTQQRLATELERIQKDIQEKTAALGNTFDSAQDWHDNPAYDFLQQKLAVLETMQTNYVATLSSPEIIEPRKEVDTVQLGNTVEVRYRAEEQSERYTILGPKDSATNKSWIAEDSPIASALIGCQPGSIVVLPNGMTVELIQILPGDF